MKIWPKTLPLSTHCDLYHDSVVAIDHRLKNGYWKRGVHVVQPEGVRERWIDIEQVEQWALKNSQGA